jgi:murein peptide amidase A
MFLNRIYNSLILIFLLPCLFSVSLRAFENVSTTVSADTTPEKNDIKNFCQSQLSLHKSYFKDHDLGVVCKKALALDGCKSVSGSPIFHIDEKGKNEKAKNILVFSLIHGDETDAGVLGRYWIERLEKVDPRNNWRIIPILNPDGTNNKTRTNANGVDLNRNFPTLDWNEKAISFWKSEAQKSKRKFPGYNPASEPEVNCALKHITEYKPDFVVSIHTPLRVLDFDGPKVKPPIYNYLPWKRLGNFPGSLGRLLWVEKNIPVLTTELKNDLPITASVFEQLQDVIGQLVQKDLK